MSEKDREQSKLLPPFSPSAPKNEPFTGLSTENMPYPLSLFHYKKNEDEIYRGLRVIRRVYSEFGAILQKPKKLPLGIPDLSQGLAKKQDNLNLVSLKDFAKEKLTLMVYQGDLCEFSSPCWNRLNAQESRVILHRLFSENHLDFCMTRHEYQEIYELLLIDSTIQQQEEFPPTLHKLNLNDGTLDLETMEFYPHCPEDGFFHYLDIFYDELIHATDGPVFEQFVEDISAGNPDIRRQLLELIGLAITGYEAKVFYALQIGRAHV